MNHLVARVVKVSTSKATDLGSSSSAFPAISLRYTISFFSGWRGGGGGRAGRGFLRVSPFLIHRLVGLVVKASASRAEDPGFESRLQRDFSGSNHTSDLKIGTPAATLPGAWQYRVSAGTGRTGVSIL